MQVTYPPEKLYTHLMQMSSLNNSMSASSPADVEKSTNEINRLLETVGGNALTLYCEYTDCPASLLAAVRTLCQRVIDVNICNHRGSNALLAFLDNRAMINQYPKTAELVVETLISRGFNVHHVDHFGNNALWKLIGHCSDPRTIYPIAKLLLASGVKINYVHPLVNQDAVERFLLNRLTLIHYEIPVKRAAQDEARYMHKLIKLFVNYGLRKFHPLFTFVFLDRIKHQPIFVKTVKLLIDSGCDANFHHCSVAGANSVIHACFQPVAMPRESNLPNLIGFLVRNGANVNRIDRSKEEENALMLFLKSIPFLDWTGLKVITALCDYGINVNHTTRPAANEYYDCVGIDALGLVCKLDKFNATDILSIARILVDHGGRVDEDTLWYLFSERLNLFEEFLSDEVSDYDYASADEDGHDEVGDDIADVYEEDDGGAELMSKQEETAMAFRSNVLNSFISWLRVDSTLSRCFLESEYIIDNVQHEALDYDSPDVDERLFDDREMQPIDADQWQGWYDMIEFLMDNGANVNCSLAERSESALAIFLRYYEGNDFVKILELMSRYGPLDVNKSFSLFVNVHDSVDALEALSLNQYQRERFNEAALLLIREGLNQGALFGAKNRNNTIIKGFLSNERKHHNVIFKIKNKSYGF